ncbi:MAG: hypothetical protein CNC89_03075 [Puniceicoccaceae bacterium MED-G31]|nr:MAG: hypothetical protein CNC89_03075 [Puniceicoccaceae bacterium MED-G31]
MMESLLEVLFPLIVAGVYFFGNILSKKKDKSAAPSPFNQEEVSPAEREVQEQIKRKIEARRASYDSSESELLTKTEQDNSHSPEDLVREQLKERRDNSRARRQVAQPRDTAAPAQSFKEQSKEYAWRLTEAENNYAQEMENRRKKLEDTQRKAKALRKKSKQGAYTIKQAMRQDSSRSLQTKGQYAGPIRTRLRSPSAAREAFIYSEVLGAPIALKKSSSLPN